MEYEQFLRLGSNGWLIVVNLSVMAFIAYCLIEVALVFVKSKRVAAYLAVAFGVWVFLAVVTVLLTVPIEKGRFFGTILSELIGPEKPLFEHSTVIWLPAVAIAVLVKYLLRLSHRTRKTEAEK